ncbi:MAG: hypothetical protein AAF485_09540 [Chloroflexota bacterium]
MTTHTTFITKRKYKRNRLNTIVQQVSRTQQPHSIDAAIDQVYPVFAARYPALATILFDKHFLKNGGYDVLSGYEIGQAPTALDLAQAWEQQLGPAREAVRQRRINEMVPVAAEFLRGLEYALAK